MVDWLVCSAQSILNSTPDAGSSKTAIKRRQDYKSKTLSITCETHARLGVSRRSLAAALFRRMRCASVRCLITQTLADDMRAVCACEYVLVYACCEMHACKSRFMHFGKTGSLTTTAILIINNPFLTYSLQNSKFKQTLRRMF